MPFSEEFLSVMTMLGVAFRVEANEPRIKLYADQLSDLSLDQLKVAAVTAVRECKFFPTVSELRRFAFGSIEDRALVAWSGLMQAASRVGAYRTVEIDDGVAALALAHVFGSWPEFCQAEDSPALAQLRQEFLATYRRFAPSTPRVPVLLKGWAAGEPVRLSLSEGAMDHERALIQGRGRAMELTEGKS